MTRKEVLICLFIAVVIAVFLSPFASRFPDGLEWVAEKMGFIAKGEAEPLVKAPMPDYSFPIINENSVWNNSLSGLAGVFLTFLLAVGIGKLLMPKQDNFSDNSSQISADKKGEKT